MRERLEAPGRRWPHELAAVAARSPRRPAWVEMEERVLDFWRERDVFQRSLEERAGAEPPYVFYEGPPTANGRPGSPTTCSRASSRTSSRASRPCAGASSTGGAAGTATACRSRSRSRSASASRASRRSRPTASPSSTRSAASRCSPTSTSGSASPSASASGSTPTGPTARWTATTSRASGGASPSCFRRGLLYQSDKVVPYCPRCGTALSSHEVAQGYEDVDDPSVYVRFPLRGRAGRVAAGLDDHAVDAAVQPGRRGQPGRDLRRGRARRRDADPGRARWSSAVLRRGRPGRRA